MEKEKGKKKPRGDKDERLSDLIGGSLNLFGIQIDLGKLLDSPEEVRERLETLRDRLKGAGGQEVLSDEAWRQGRASVSGYVRTRGVLGEGEFHIGSMGKERAQRGAGEQPPGQEEAVEPPLEVFDEGGEVVIVAEVPGVGLEDLEVKVEGRAFSLASRSGARRSYRKTVRLDAEVDADSLKAACRNGVLEVRLRKREGSG